MNKKTKICICICILLPILLLITCGVYGYRQYFDMDEKKIQQKTKNYAQLYEQAPKEATVFFGDSITERCPLEDIYATYMKTSGVPVVNRGISSEKTGEMLARIEESVLSIKPRNLVMLMGINDVFAGVEHKQIVDHIQQIIDITKEKSPNTNIILQSIYPINMNVRNSLFEKIQGYGKGNDIVIALNKDLQKLARSENITFVNVYAQLIDDEGNLKEEYAYDGLHPNTAGYLAIRESIVDVLK